MSILLHYNTLFYLALILVLCTIPVYLYRKDWKETAIIAGTIVCFVILNRKVLGGGEQFGVWYDLKGYEHFFLNTIKQWLDGNISIGWNPYINGGEPFYWFSNFFLWAPWVFLCWVNKFINISSHLLFVLFWFFLFINFCIGCYLLFCLLYEDSKVALFSFITLMFSGFFPACLYQPLGLTIMYYLPYILFGVISSWKTKKIYGIALAVIFFGILANHYQPTYLVITFSVFIILIFCFNFSLERLSSLSRLISSHYKIILPAFLLSLMAASPALFTYSESGNFVSPNRGESRGAVTTSMRGGNTPYISYKTLLTDNFLKDHDKLKYPRWPNIPSDAYMMKTHQTFYFGIIPLLIIPFAFFPKKKNRFLWALLCSIIIMVYLATGHNSWGFRFLTRFPLLNLMRHGAWFTPFATFLLFCLFGYGLKELFNIFENNRFKYFLIVLFTVMVLISGAFNVFLVGALFLMLVFLVNSRRSFYGKEFIVKHLYLIVLLISIFDLFYNYRLDPRSNYYHITPENSRVFSYYPDFVYPLTRTLYPLMGVDKMELQSHARKDRKNFGEGDLFELLLKNKIILHDEYNPSYAYLDDAIKTKKQLRYRLKQAGLNSKYLQKMLLRRIFPPPDLSSLIHKKASLTHPRTNFMFFRALRLNDMLKLFIPDKNYDTALGVNSPIIYFTQHGKTFSEDIPKEQIIKSIYEDAVLHPSSPQRSVFFRENEIDFSVGNKRDKLQDDALIKYTHRQDPNKIEFKINAPSEGFLVRLENYHTGWQAFIDGKKTSVYRANYAFQAIKVPGGEHKVSFQFSSIYPYLFYCHIGIVLLTWFLFNRYLIYLASANNNLALRSVCGK